MSEATRTVWFGLQYADLKPMVDDRLRQWLQIHMEAALLRATCQPMSLAGMGVHEVADLQAAGLLEAFLQGLHERTPTVSEASGAVASLEKADLVLCAMALMNAEWRDDQHVYAAVAQMSPEERCEVIAAQNDLNHMAELAPIIPLETMLYARVMAGVGNG